ncbi:MAG: prepilin-type N-terminal cleavage/methylation domain-containing protein [Candidatus Dojkabacteria bacterium]|nr:MAG: prepilin-type N-terminal cleavage/methylation domain-containing protein [Candidatus Dojkabacteria bacterium]
MKTADKYKGFTLMEMIIVIVIFMILFAMSISAFSGLRSTIALNEAVKNLEQDIRNAQRDALLLSRGKDEKWLYGIGIDFSDFPQTGEYRVFKWCSQFDDFGDPKTTSDFPNYDPAVGDLGSATNGNFPQGNYVESCTRGGSTFSSNSTSLVEMSGTGIVPIEYPIMIGVNQELTGQGGAPAFPAYVVFESTTGRAFFYDNNGRILNYDGDGDLESDAFDFEVVLATVDRDHNRMLRIRYSSGKIELDKVSTEDLGKWVFPADPANQGGGQEPPNDENPPSDDIPPNDERPPNDDSSSDNETPPIIPPPNDDNSSEEEDKPSEDDDGGSGEIIIPNI